MTYGWAIISILFIIVMVCGTIHEYFSINSAIMYALFNAWDYLLLMVRKSTGGDD